MTGIFEFPWKIQVTDYPYGDQERHAEMAQWCVNNLEAKNWIYDMNSFEFENERDYMLFLMTFS